MPRRRLTFLLAPRWLALHVVVLAISVSMVLLGRWQLDVAMSHEWPLQNSAYAFQWWAFTAFTLALWVKIMYDATDKAAARRAARVEPPPLDPVPYRRYVMPQSSTAPVQPADAEHAAYNAYLAGLAERDRREAGIESGRRDQLAASGDEGIER